jgi:D-alanyl-D-alanine carboxypeptidase
VKIGGERNTAAGYARRDVHAVANYLYVISPWPHAPEQCRPVACVQHIERGFHYSTRGAEFCPSPPGLQMKHCISFMCLTNGEIRTALDAKHRAQMQQKVRVLHSSPVIPLRVHSISFLQAPYVNPHSYCMRIASLLALLIIPAVAPTGGGRIQVAAGVAAAPSTIQDRNTQLRARLQAKLDSLHAAGRFPGATFAAALSDGSVISVATGMNDTTRKLPMKITDRMPQGSVGKTYVSALAMQLIHERKLALDAPISQYLGSETWFARLPNANAITVRHLMTHTSGLVRYEFNPRFTSDLSRAPADKIWTPVELITYMFDSPPPFAPGTGWEYSDTNYMILGIIMEKIMGRPLIQEIQRRFVASFGLNETVANLAPVVPGIAQGYAGASNPFGGTDAMLTNGRFAFNPQFEWAGGGWSSTTSDLARWGGFSTSGRPSTHRWLRNSCAVCRRGSGRM